MRGVVCATVLLAAAAGADDKKDAPVRATYAVGGLFAPDRVADLRAAFRELPDIKLVDVNYESAEMTVVFVPGKAFPGTKPTDYLKQFDGKLRSATHSTFSVKPLGDTPKDQLQLVEIKVAGIHCKACELAAYEAVAKLDGVERATASFQEGRVTARIDPAKTDVAKLEAALKQKGVTIVPK